MGKVAARYAPALTATVAAVIVKPERVQVDACLLSMEQIARVDVTNARMADVIRILVTALVIVLLVTTETAVKISVAPFAWTARALKTRAIAQIVNYHQKAQAAWSKVLYSIQEAVKNLLCYYVYIFF